MSKTFDAFMEPTECEICHGVFCRGGMHTRTAAYCFEGAGTLRVKRYYQCEECVLRAEDLMPEAQFYRWVY